MTNQTKTGNWNSGYPGKSVRKTSCLRNVMSVWELACPENTCLAFVGHPLALRREQEKVEENLC